MGVSCSADRNIKAKINKDGIWIEKLEDNPARLIPESMRQAGESGGVKIDLNRPMPEILAELSKYPVLQPFAERHHHRRRDIAHAKLKERIDRGEGLPSNQGYPIYYAGPAKTTRRYCLRFDGAYPRPGGWTLMSTCSSRTRQHDHAWPRKPKSAVTDALQEVRRVHLGSIGRPAAILGTKQHQALECLDIQNWHGAIWKIEVEDSRIHPGWR